MALTRARFSSKYLEPLALREIQVQMPAVKEPPANLHNHHTLPLRLTPLKQSHVDKAKCAQKVLKEQDYEFIFRNSRPSDAEFFSSKHFPSPTFARLEISRRPKALIPSNTAHKKSRSVRKDAKREVSFSLPPISGKENSENARKIKKEIAEIVAKVLSDEEKASENAKLSETEKRAKLSEVEKSAKLPEVEKRVKPDQSATPEIRKRTPPKHKWNPQRRQPHNLPRPRKNGTTTLPRFTQRQQARQDAETGKTRSRNPRKESALTMDYVNTLEKARQTLLGKLKFLQQNPKRYVPRRRVMYLPTLAAPCSEEFAATMRRFNHGKRFVTSPAVYDHVIRNDVGFRATATLLDAVLRPPSSTRIT